MPLFLPPLDQPQPLDRLACCSERKKAIDAAAGPSFYTDDLMQRSTPRVGIGTGLMRLRFVKNLPINKLLMTKSPRVTCCVSEIKHHVYIKEVEKAIDKHKPDEDHSRSTSGLEQY